METGRVFKKTAALKEWVGRSNTDALASGSIVAGREPSLVNRPATAI
jgi:hypothetical protein